MLIAQLIRGKRLGDGRHNKLKAKEIDKVAKFSATVDSVETYLGRNQMIWKTEQIVNEVQNEYLMKVDNQYVAQVLR